MFATFDADGVARGNQILIADRPAGLYTEWSDGPVTPSDWDCSGGTLHVDDARDPWIVFSHDWTQIGDGEIVAQRLTEDLTRPIGRPLVLFYGSDAEWTRHFFRPRVPGADFNHVADGPFVHRLRSGELLILWSSLDGHGNAIGVARSETGRIAGRWLQQLQPLLSRDGGPGMIARTLAGQLLLGQHHPNEIGHERAVFYPIEETSKSIRFIGQHPG